MSSSKQFVRAARSNGAVVFDCSAIVRALADDYPVLRDRLAEAPEAYAPDLIDVEFASALRGLVVGAKLTPDRAVSALEDFTQFSIWRLPHLPLLGRVWQLRNNLTAYDATYIALSEALGLPLVTTDARLAGAAGHSAEVELF
jgi:predicted nucleic acid-binding protein